EKVIRLANTDTLTKQFVKDKEVFADAFNYFLHDGKNVIKPEELKVADTTEVIVPYGEDGTGLKIQPVQKIRDVFYSVMTEENKVYMLCGIENQAEPHNAMPVRTALYDIMEYVAQIQEAAKAHREVKNRGKGNDFLSGFHATDRLIPVYTLVVYWGSGEWDAPRSLFEMLDVQDERELYG
ncbi:MAG: Rpn family recombination-promoting nuclease/putative transposase, partial [Lachnospiraceae bacterium]|nr:Rpn family recombination-promoting nuclease/putative transposase [Lachnospiraceae bacterium]